MPTSSTPLRAPQLSVPRKVSLAVGIMLSLVAASPRSEAQPSPRGPEVVIDPNAGSYTACPLIAGRRNGEAALLWNRFEGGDSFALSVWYGEPNSQSGVTSTLADSADFGGLFAATFTTVPGGYRASWTRSLPPRYDRHFVSTTVDLHGRRPPMERDLGRTYWRVELSARPRGGFVARWPTARGLALQLLDDEGHALGAPSTIRVEGFFVVFRTSVLHQTDGSFVVLLSTGRSGEDGFVDLGLLGQRVDARGRPIGRPYRLLSPRDNGFQYEISSLGPDGSLAIAATVSNDSEQEELPTNSEVSLRIFTSEGLPLSPRIEITPSTRSSRAEAVVVDPTGRVLLIWSAASTDGTSGRYHAQVFSPTGARLGEEFAFASEGSSYSFLYCASADWAGDDWLIAWNASRPNLAPAQIFLRRFARDE